MAFGKLINLFALSSLAVLVCTLGASPVSALSNGHHMAKVKRAHGHDVVAKHKRDNTSSQRCKARSSTDAQSSTDAPSSTWSSSSSAWTPTSTWSSSSSSWTPSSSSSSAPAASSSSSSSNGNKKVGLAWANGNTNTLSNFVTNNVQYIYTWSESCPDQSWQLNLECMPMLWSNAGDKVAAFQSKVKAGYAKFAMGFNEVNEPGQANMDVGSAVSAWNQYLTPLVDQGYQLIAPVTSSNPNGKVWMQQFMSQVDTSKIAGMPIHYYGTNAQDMIDYIEDWHSTFNKPIWITEFACQNFNTANENNGQQCSEGQVWDFYKTIMQYASNTDKVVAAFPFGFMTEMQGVNVLDQLMSGGGSPSALGATIINNSW
ncbi:glycosyl hydrolase catalytic core-domain-containing protein [Phellopilus nigrolimitatus]|nr:glycosyl hydrolase catalytic core-domain-containing protein [Phellopilus nigrolimitatus]